MNFSVLTHGVMAFQLNVPQTLMAEEEPHEDHSQKSKTDKEKNLLSYLLRSQSDSQKSALALTHFNLRLSKGFADKPYMPPEVI